MRLYFLLQRAQDGDEEAIMNVYLKFDLTIQKMSRNLDYEEAETDLKITFLETLKGIKIDKIRIKDDGAIINYIYRIFKNNSVNLFKKHVLGKPETTQLELDILVDPVSVDLDSNIFITTLLNSLPPLQKEVLEKKFIQDFSEKKIAQLLGISRQAVNRSKNRGLMNLRKNLDLNEEGEFWKKKYCS